MKFILGKKIEMSQRFEDEGTVIPVTLVSAESCFVAQLKTKEKDGYNSVQIGIEKIIKKNKCGKSMGGKPYRTLKEFRGDVSNYKVGDKIEVSIFKEGDVVNVSGISKGKGFQGAVKRWGFAGRGASHGVKHEARTLGSVGCRFPQRVIKGKKMPGQMGRDRTTVKNLKIVKIDKDNNIMAIKGAIPGRRGTLLEIREIIRL